MEFSIKNRWSGEVIFTAEIEASEETPFAIRIGLAVKKAIEVKADLRSANLSFANLSFADLSSADLRSANLSSANLSSADLSFANLRSADLSFADLSSADLSFANLRSANLRSANLRSANLRTFKADFWMILAQNAHEVPGLIAALKDGRVDGSTYHGDCACLVGTLANVRGVHVDTLEQDSSRPAEQWFLMISKGDKPGDDSGGRFAAKQAVEWAEEFLALWSPTAVAAQGVTERKDQ